MNDSTVNDSNESSNELKPFFLLLLKKLVYFWVCVCMGTFEEKQYPKKKLGKNRIFFTNLIV